MKKLIYMVIALGLLACSKKEQNSMEDDKIGKCLLAKDYKYEALLTKADIAKHIKIDEATYKRKISSIQGKYGSCSYEWLSGRPDIQVELLGQIIKGPDKNRVTIKMLDFYTDNDLQVYSQVSAVDLFDQGYKKLSEQEYKVLLANLEKEYAGKPNEFEKAKGFLDIRMDFKYEPIEDLGNRAYWKWHDTHGIELVVLAGAARFTIESKTSGDKVESLADAVQFAKEVLAKCQTSK